MKKARLLVAASMIVPALLSTMALAQETADGVSTSDIIVTAQRRAERLEDVPISITALTSDTLEKANVTNLRDLQNVAPSFKVSSSGVFMQLAIRGVTSTALGPGVENNIAVYVDGFYQPSSTGLGGDLANVDNVQILKGPQGTLYGRNATGGAMLVTTREPSSDKFIFDAAAGYGNLDDRRARVYIGVPLNEAVSIGIGAYSRKNDGYIKDISGRDAAPFESHEVRAKMKVELSPDLNVVLGYNRVYKSDGTTYAYGTTKNLFLGGLAGYPVPPVGPLWTNEIGKASVDKFPDVTSLVDEVTGKISWNLGFGKLTSYTSYAEEDFHVDVDFDGTKLPYANYDAWWYRKTFQQAIDFQTDIGDTLDLIIGGQYYHDDSTQISKYYAGSAFAAATVGSPLMAQSSDSTQKTRGLAGYADITWNAAENLYLNAGIRYSHDRRSMISYTTGSQIGAGNVLLPAPIYAPTPPFPILRAPPTTRSFSSWTPRFTVRYEFSPGMNVYASYSQGFKSGVFNSAVADAYSLTNPVRPEKITAYEVGVKGATGPLYFDAAAFYYDYKDLQVSAVTSFIDPVLGAQTRPLLINAATAEIWGLEGSFTYKVTDAFNVRFAGAYTHARYKDFPTANVVLETSPGRYGTTTQNLSGRRISRAPDWTFNIGADYTIPVGDGKVVVAASGAYSSAYAPASEAYDPATGRSLYYQSGYFQANGSIDWNLPGDHLTIGAWINNITDKQYKIIEAAEAVGARTILSTPRTYGLRVGYKY